MTLTKQKKRILLIALPAALAVIAAAVILLLLLGREEEYKPFDVRRDQNTNAITYCAVKGEMELNFQTVSSIQLPCYSFLPTQGWTMTQDGMSNSSVAANPGIPWYSDLYENEAGEEMGFYQMPAAADLLTDRDPDSGVIYSGPPSLLPSEIQEVEFGDIQVIYYQRHYTDYQWENESRVGYTVTRSGAYWVHQQSLLNLDCPGELDINQVLELISQVDYESLREPVEVQQPVEPLYLQQGSAVNTNTPDGQIVTEHHSYCSMGNPEIPDQPQMLTFTPPEGYSLEGSEEDPQGGQIQQKYVNGQGELISYFCRAGVYRFFEQDQGTGQFYLPFQGISTDELADPDAVQDATVNGNPAFVHINDDVAEIGWIDGYCSLQLRCTAPMTAEELIALAETVA